MLYLVTQIPQVYDESCSFIVRLIVLLIRNSLLLTVESVRVVFSFQCGFVSCLHTSEL